MPNTTPDGIYYPDVNTNLVPLSNQFSLLAGSVQDALSSARKVGALYSASGVSARDSFNPTPTQGDRVWRNDLGYVEVYYGLFNATTNPGGATPAGWYPAAGSLAGGGETVSSPINISGGTSIPFNSTVGSMTTPGNTAFFTHSGGEYTCVRPGWYHIRGTVRADGISSNGDLYLALAGVSIDRDWHSPEASSFATYQVEVARKFSTGDVISLRFGQNRTTIAPGDSLFSWRYLAPPAGA